MSSPQRSRPPVQPQKTGSHSFPSSPGEENDSGLCNLLKSEQSPSPPSLARHEFGMNQSEERIEQHDKQWHLAHPLDYHYKNSRYNFKQITDHFHLGMYSHVIWNKKAYS